MAHVVCDCESVDTDLQGSKCKCKWARTCAASVLRACIRASACARARIDIMAYRGVSVQFDCVVPLDHELDLLRGIEE